MSFGRWCFLWLRLRVNSAACVFAVSNCSPHRFAHLILLAAHLPSIETLWLTSLPVANHPWSSTQVSPSASDTNHLRQLISPEVYIAKRIGETVEPCGTPDTTGCLSITLLSSIISTVLSERKFSVHLMRSPFIYLTLIKLTSLSFATLGKAALMSMRSTPAIWQSLQAA